MTRKAENSASVPKTIAGYTFKSLSLLDEALTHPSLSGSYNYQRLEFLGDRVLGLAISTWLLEEFPRDAEGQLNRRFTALVRKETLAEISRNLKLVDQLKVTPGAEAEGTRDKEAIQSDVCESIIGAIYLDAGFDAANGFIRRHWKDLIGAGVRAHKDSKTQLQEWCQARAASMPTYEVVDRVGPDHDPIFTIEVAVEGKGSARASGAAKRIAEQAAADRLLTQLTGGQSGSK